MSVCRLCMATDELMWLFDDKLSRDMPEIVKIASGVEINKTDTVSQMVCRTCFKLALRIYIFRTKSIKNDNDLKVQSMGNCISQLAKLNFKKETTSIRTSSRCSDVSTASEPHPSILKIIVKNPELIIPPAAFILNVEATVTVYIDEADEWLKRNNHTAEQIDEMKKAALMALNTIDKNSQVAKKWNECSDVSKTKTSACKIVPAVDSSPNEDVDDMFNVLVRLLEDGEAPETNTTPVASKRKQETGLAVSAKKSKKTTPNKRKSSTYDKGTSSEPNKESPSTKTIANKTSNSGTLDKEKTDQTKISPIFVEDIKKKLYDKLHNSAGASDPQPSTSSTTNNVDQNKMQFIQSLNLLPKGVQYTNSPDLSLLQPNSRTYTLHTCTICDAPQSSARWLRLHMQRMHTRCPFCNKRFRTLTLREAHIKDCPKNKTAFVTENTKVTLTKVNAVKTAKKASKNAATKAALEEPVVETDNSAKSADEVVYISDEESEEHKKINVVWSDCMSTINLDDDDAKVFKEVLRLEKMQECEKRGSASFFDNKHIVETLLGRIRIFKNLSSFLRVFHIPVTVRNESSLGVRYELLAGVADKTTKDLWTDHEPLTLHPPVIKLENKTKLSESHELIACNGDTDVTKDGSDSTHQTHVGTPVELSNCSGVFHALEEVGLKSPETSSYHKSPVEATSKAGADSGGGEQAVQANCHTALPINITEATPAMCSNTTTAPVTDRIRVRPIASIQASKPISSVSNISASDIMKSAMHKLSNTKSPVNVPIQEPRTEYQMCNNMNTYSSQNIRSRIVEIRATTPQLNSVQNGGYRYSNSYGQFKGFSPNMISTISDVASAQQNVPVCLAPVTVAPPNYVYPQSTSLSPLIFTSVDSRVGSTNPSGSSPTTAQNGSPRARSPSGRFRGRSMMEAKAIIQLHHKDNSIGAPRA